MSHIAEQLAEKSCEVHGTPRQKNGVCPKCYFKAWYERNRADKIAQTAEWKEQNRDKHLEAKRRWRKRHEEQVRRGNRHRRATLAGAEERPYTEAEVYALHGYHCYLCGLPMNPDATGPGVPTFDHVIPLSRGGADVLDNVRPAHKGCNSRKHDRLLDELAA